MNDMNWLAIYPEILLLAMFRMLISRLPLIPNKDLVFAAMTVFLIGADPAIGAVVAQKWTAGAGDPLAVRQHVPQLLRGAVVAVLRANDAPAGRGDRERQRARRGALRSERRRPRRLSLGADRTRCTGERTRRSHRRAGRAAGAMFPARNRWWRSRAKHVRWRARRPASHPRSPTRLASAPVRVRSVLQALHRGRGSRRSSRPIVARSMQTAARRRPFGDTAAWITRPNGRPGLP